MNDCKHENRIPCNCEDCDNPNSQGERCADCEAPIWADKEN